MTFTELSSDVLETIRRDDVRVQVCRLRCVWDTWGVGVFCVEGFEKKGAM